MKVDYFFSKAFGITWENPTNSIGRNEFTGIWLIRAIMKDVALEDGIFET